MMKQCNILEPEVKIEDGKFDITHFLSIFQTLPSLWLKADNKYKNRNARNAAENYLLDIFKHFSER